MRPSLLALALIAACGRAEEPQALGADGRLASTLAELEASGAFAEQRPARAEAAARAFEERLEELDASLAEEPDWWQLTPEWWDAGGWRDVSEEIDSFTPFFNDVGRLIAQPPTDRALSAEEAPPLRPVPPAHPPRPTPAPTDEGERGLRLVELLCVRALNLHARQDHELETVLVLTQALDLIRLLDDGSLGSLVRSVRMGRQVLRTLQVILPGPELDPEFVRAQLEPRLAAIARREPLVQALRRESARRLGRGSARDGAPPPKGAVATGLDLYEFSTHVRATADPCVLTRARGQPQHMTTALLATREHHAFAIECALARMALALHEYPWLNGDWPRFSSDLVGFVDPEPDLGCRSLLLVYERDINTVRLFLRGRQKIGKEADNPLHVWIWDRRRVDGLRHLRPPRQDVPPEGPASNE